MIDLFEERTNRIGFEREINEIHIEFSKFPFSKKLITANILKGFERKKNSYIQNIAANVKTSLTHSTRKHNGVKSPLKITAK